ncbi:uncharacterized protein LOC143225080 isoform X2 [Tachypleus tridentatus]|uniref:uncharacterized protein LOC143225080 isoform X2 n=1 Tax=Tachypleus tridentatus TaxID=6853 RepID=UPI003FD578F6
MTSLNETTVLCRTRAQDLKSVKKLNCWGSELCDVSIIKHMPNVEVLSLSVNRLSSLADFAHCPNLQELYIRKNNISNINEICYLQNVSKLRSLWLADNPCAEKENYRMTVLRTLPHLQKLDNLMVQPEEIVRAQKEGDILIHPEDIVEKNESPLGAKEMHSVKPIHIPSSVPQAREFNCNNLRKEEICPTRPEVLMESASRKEDNAIKQERRAAASLFARVEKDPFGDIYSPGRAENCQPFHLTSEPSSQHGVVPHQHAFHARVQTLVDHSGRRSRKNVELGCENSLVTRTSDTASIGHPIIDSKDLQQALESDSSGSIGDGYRYVHRVQPLEVRHISHSDNMHHNGSNQKGDKVSPTRLLTKGGKNRNANILSAVLCLIKELDYASLEVVETAIHCRMEEMDD